jgi:hypothetical protein
LKEEQAIYLYPPPKLSASLSKFVLICVPNGVKPLDENQDQKEKKKQKTGKYTKKNAQNEELAEVIPFDYEIERASPSYRWVVPAHSEFILAVSFHSNSPGSYDTVFHFETVESHDRYSVNCHVVCGFPTILRDPELIFGTQGKDTVCSVLRLKM